MSPQVLVQARGGANGARYIWPWTRPSDIRAVELTPSRDGDSPVLSELLGQIPADEQIDTVTAPVAR